MWHEWMIYEIYTKVWLGNLIGRDPYGDLDLGEKITLKYILEGYALKLWT
jgi:hypothetical protein